MTKGAYKKRTFSFWLFCGLVKVIIDMRHTVRYFSGSRSFVKNLSQYS